MWFPDEGDPRHGTPDDPRLVLIGVTAHAVEFLEVNKPKPVVLFELAKGLAHGNPAGGRDRTPTHATTPQRLAGSPSLH